MKKRRTSTAPSKDIISECYARSLELLKKNSRPGGIIACAYSEKSVDRNYASVFGRDAAICSLGMTVTKDSELLKSAEKSLITLAEYQAENGQIPKYVKPKRGEVDFWYSGCIDATLWWLIAVDFYNKHAPESRLGEILNAEIKLALNWLLCQEHQGMYLLQQNEASDWADIMPRSGFVLYSNSLWYLVKELYGIPTADMTKYFFNLIFFPFDDTVPENRRARILRHYIRNKSKGGDFYLSFVNFSFWGGEIDVFANILGMLFGLAPASKASRIVDSFLKLKVNIPYPVRVVHEPIRRNSRFWRAYMQRRRQNYPHQYHNGGIWLFAGGFWVMLLAKMKKTGLAREELRRLAEACSINNWEFNEWLHGKTGKPGGMPGQSWNAAMFILAFHALRGKINL